MTRNTRLSVENPAFVGSLSPGASGVTMILYGASATSGANGNIVTVNFGEQPVNTPYYIWPGGRGTSGAAPGCEVSASGFNRAATGQGTAVLAGESAGSLTASSRVAVAGGGGHNGDAGGAGGAGNAGASGGAGGSTIHTSGQTAVGGGSGGTGGSGGFGGSGGTGGAGGGGSTAGTIGASGSSGIQGNGGGGGGAGAGRFWAGSSWVATFTGVIASNGVVGFGGSGTSNGSAGTAGTSVFVTQGVTYFGDYVGSPGSGGAGALGASSGSGGGTGSRVDNPGGTKTITGGTGGSGGSGSFGSSGTSGGRGANGTNLIVSPATQQEVANAAHSGLGRVEVFEDGVLVKTFNPTGAAQLYEVGK